MSVELNRVAGPVQLCFLLMKLSILILRELNLVVLVEGVQWRLIKEEMGMEITGFRMSQIQLEKACNVKMVETSRKVGQTW